MKKFLKFKKVGNGIKLCKTEFFSKKERKNINKLILKNKVSIYHLQNKNIFKIMKEKNNSIIIYFMNYESLKNIFSKAIGGFLPMIGKRELTNHIFALGRTGVGKTKFLTKQLEETVVDIGYSHIDMDKK